MTCHWSNMRRCPHATLWKSHTCNNMIAINYLSRIRYLSQWSCWYNLRVCMSRIVALGWKVGQWRKDMTKHPWPWRLQTLWSHAQMHKALTLRTIPLTVRVVWVQLQLSSSSQSELLHFAFEVLLDFDLHLQPFRKCIEHCVAHTTNVVETNFVAF